MVIQEAFVCGRPVIAADIGGMREKVRDGVDGLHFQARNSLSLATVLRDAASMDNQGWLCFYKRISQPINYKQCAIAHKVFS